MSVRVVEVAEDVPSEKLVIRNIDKPVVAFRTRLGCLSVLIVPWLGFTFFYLTTRSDRWVEFLLETSLIHLAAIALIAGVLIRFDRLLSLSVDRASGRIDYEVGVPGTIRHDAGSFAVDDVASITGRVPRGFERGNKLDLPIKLSISDAAGETLLSHGLRVNAADTDREMLDFLLRLGSATGLSHYTVLVRDPLNYAALLTREPTDRSTPIPPISSPADYSLDRVEESLVLPDEVVADFDEAKPIGGGYRVTTWQPGEEIVIRKGRRPLRWAGLLLLVAIACAAAALWMDPALFAPFRNDRWVWLIVIAVAVTLSIMTLYRLSFSCRFDLRARSVNIREGFRFNEERLNGLSAVVLRRWFTGGGTKAEGQPRRTFRHLGMSMRRQSGPPIPILEMVTSNYDRSIEQQDRLYPFVVALAKQIGIRHEYLETGHEVESSPEHRHEA